MSFLVKYIQDIPNNCSECPCSVHVTPKEIYCNARQKHFEVTNNRPKECGMIECNEEKYKPESCDKCKYHQVNGLFDYCGFDDGLMLMDDNTDYEKQRDPKCPLN